MAFELLLFVALAISAQSLLAQYLPSNCACGTTCGPQPVTLSSLSLLKETFVYPPGSVVVAQPSCGCGSNPCGCGNDYISLNPSCNSNPCSCNASPCGCNASPCGCNASPCGCNASPCGCVSTCGCYSEPCSCNQELILPPPFVQLPCGCGFSESAIPLVASAYGSYPCSCGTFVEPYYTTTCGCDGAGLNTCGYADPLVSLSLSGNAGCGCCYPGFGVPSVSYVLPSCGCGTANACGCGAPNCGCAGGCGCGLTLATPVCPNLAALAVPVVL